MTKALSQTEKNMQLLHIFEVSLIAGGQDSRIWQKYIAPVITAPQIEIIPLFPGNAAEERILKLIAASFRECYRVFHNCLHMTPADYIKAYRLQAACRRLAKGQESVTVISHDCGLGSSSYFGKVFREYAHCSPTEYRRKWQNSDR